MPIDDPSSQMQQPGGPAYTERQAYRKQAGLSPIPPPEELTARRTARRARVMGSPTEHRLRLLNQHLVTMGMRPLSVKELEAVLAQLEPTPAMPGIVPRESAAFPALPGASSEGQGGSASSLSDLLSGGQ